ncbi:Transporter/ MFS family protein/Sugar transport family protein [Giardia duodenalis assemblage B]|uniref:Lysosomal dipeptide transporter MFSD1 n=1 Tax=Giardia duodenalis assemblage B TaxID=1394984 RepID=A0A132NZH3_GIAIN|nr:Transporter/ MFS family protein/Sugar transport family protein [Giardia intestinalis assemblage B]
MTTSVRRGIITIVFCTIAYMFSYIHRMCIASITDLMQDRYAVELDKIGILVSTFFYTYSVLQPFAGLTIDILQARWVVLVSGFLIAVGSILLGCILNFPAACVFRALTGIGSAFLYVATVKYAMLWLEPKQFVICTGSLAASSGVASLIASAPLRYLADAIGLKLLFVILGVCPLIASVVVGIVGNYPPSYYADGKRTMKDAIRDFKGGFQELGRTRTSLFLIPLLIYYFFFSGANYTISAFLGVVFITSLNQTLSKTYATWMFLLQSIGLIISGVTIPHVAKFIGRKPPHIIAPILVSGLMFCIAFFKEQAAGWKFGTVYFFYGILTGATIPIGYTLCKELVPPNILATAIGLFNFYPALGGAIFQNTFPLLLRNNTLSEYQTIAFILAGQYLLCAVVGAFLKETSEIKIKRPCKRPQYKDTVLNSHPNVSEEEVQMNSTQVHA